MQGYWLGIMALAFALAMAAWIVLVFRAGSHPGNKMQESIPHREIIGGSFDAREGGRQLMPHPGEPAAGPEKSAPGRDRPSATKDPAR